MPKLFISLVFLSLSLGAQAQLYKVSERGDILQPTATEFACVLDDQSKLLWEVKSIDQGLQHQHNTYTWFDGQTGVEDGQYSRHCHWGEACNTQRYVTALNQAKLCHQGNWRLPSEHELKTLVNYGDTHLLIDLNFFPQTQAASYWSADEVDAEVAVDVPFFYGGVGSSDKLFDAHIRAVSSVD